jgi:formamidopyrimidine-DNA glycosylase
VPELPEVETVVRGLRKALPGRSIVGVRLGKTDFIDDPAALEELLPGSRIARVERFGKYIRLELSASESVDGSDAPGGSGNRNRRQHLIVHLGMTGRLRVVAAHEPSPPHTHGFFELDDGRELRYTDARRFGRILLLPDSEIAAFCGRLGQDPLRISTSALTRGLAGRRAKIKALLLDQGIVCGVGNIYADESLWLARIHPARLAARLTSAEVDRLRRAMSSVLRAAIRLRGSSVSNFVDADGNPGGYQGRHRVYHRHGRACARCGGKIRRMLVAGRSSHFCPRCQPPPRTKRARASQRLKAARRLR